MSNNSDEKLSALMDDEFHSDVLESLKQDSEARARWARYHLIRDVLSGHSETLPSPGFVERVSAALGDEPTVLRPVRRKLAHGVRQVAGLAIAATVATVAVLTVQQSDVTGTSGSQSIASAEKATEEYRNVSGNPSAASPIDSEVQSKLSNYLINHNEYSISSRMQGMLPYMRIVSVTPSERTVTRADDK
ncbi:MAG: sigma-E factor negative regulatory protein [Thiohalophilus sp.]